MAMVASIHFVSRIIVCLLFAAGLDLFGHKADLVDTGALRDIDDLNHVFVEQLRIGVNESRTLVAGFEDLLKLISQITKLDAVLVNLQVSRLMDRQDDRHVELIRARWMCTWRSRLRFCASKTVACMRSQRHT